MAARDRTNLEDLFRLADQLRDRGDRRSAFRLFLVAAKAGHVGSQLNVGYCYDVGDGTRRNRSAALHWYKRAYRHGHASAAHNMGTIWRDERKWRLALWWFRRAVKLGSDDSSLEIAKYYLSNELGASKAIPHLRRVAESNSVTEANAEEAKQLLKRVEGRMNR